MIDSIVQTDFSVGIERLGKARVVVVGDVMLDRYWTGATRRVSPEAPVPIVSVTEIEERAGGAANVAANCAALGASVTLVSITGADAESQRLAELCAAAGVTTDWITLPALATTVKLRVVSQHQQLLRLDFDAEVSLDRRSELVTKTRRALSHADVLVLSDYAKGVLSQLDCLIELARDMDVLVVVDPKGQDFAKYHGADLITPNLSEFEAVVGRCDDEAQMASRGRDLMARHAFGSLLITRGEQGMSLLRPEHAALHLTAHARDVYDVTGAGDTVCGVVATALAAGVSLEDAIRMANVGAGIVVARLGTAALTRTELLTALSLPGDGDVRDLATVVARVMAVQKRGERVVMTNGCFDILHAGHVRFLREAAALGQHLVVAINSDASIRRLKGEQRPINSLAQRLEVLSALECVDSLVSFDEETPLGVIERVKPDVLVKGGDYPLEKIVGADFVLANGGEVRSLSYHHDALSTTQVIAALGSANGGRRL